jgi:hypothetical protein
MVNFFLNSDDTLIIFKDIGALLDEHIVNS